MVSAWVASNGVCIGPEHVGKYSNEIKTIPKLIQSLDLEECIVTIDAIACQHDIVKAVIKNKADYVICVKRKEKECCSEFLTDQ